MLSYVMFLVDIESCQVHPILHLRFAVCRWAERTLGLPMGKVHWKSLGLKDSGEAAKRGGHKSGLFLLAKCRDDFGRSEHVHQYS